MPIYCYKCFDCNHYEEIKQSMSDDALTDCPECGGDNYKRVITSVGVIFKGSGFHINDYKSSCKIPKKAPNDDTSTEKTTEKVTESKSADSDSKNSTTDKTEKTEKKSDSGAKKSTEAA